MTSVSFLFRTLDYHLDKIELPNWNYENQVGFLEKHFGLRHLFEMIDRDITELTLNGFKIQTINIKLKINSIGGEHIGLFGLHLLV